MIFLSLKLFQYCFFLADFISTVKSNQKESFSLTLPQETCCCDVSTCSKQQSQDQDKTLQICTQEVVLRHQMCAQEGSIHSAPHQKQRNFLGKIEFLCFSQHLLT